MKVMIGWMNEIHGTVEVTPAVLVYSGEDPDQFCGIVEYKRNWHDREAVLHVLTDVELVRSLPYRMQGRSWAVYVDEQGMTIDQPRYDPWGDIWKSQ